MGTLLALVVAAAPSDVRERVPWLTVQLGFGGSARASTADTFAGVGEFKLGVRLEPVHFGLTVQGLAARELAAGAGGFLLFDLVRLKLDSALTLAAFAGAEGLAQYTPAQRQPWSGVVLGNLGLRAVGVSVTIAGGAEWLELGRAPQGEAQVRVAVDFVELGLLIERSRAQREPAFPGYEAAGGS